MHIVPIGTLTGEQVGVINAGRFVQNLKPIVAEVVFVGGHIYKSRIVRDGYTIEDVIDQISSAMDEAAEVLDAIYMTILQIQTAERIAMGIWCEIEPFLNAQHDILGLSCFQSCRKVTRSNPQNKRGLREKASFNISGSPG